MIIAKIMRNFVSKIQNGSTDSGARSTEAECARCLAYFENLTDELELVSVSLNWLRALRTWQGWEASTIEKGL